MHTAQQFSQSDFDITVNGRQASRSDLLPGWGPHDRLGIVAHQPFGAVGASHLIQLAITAYYDVRPSRRDGFPTPGNPYDPRAIYPEIYLFHVGGRWGDHSDFDFWPARKEVFLTANARLVLDAINDRAITRLAVPDRSVRSVEHEFKEPAAALDRVVNAWAYSPDGKVADPTVSIAGRARRTEVNVRYTLNPARSAASAVREPEYLDDPELVQRTYSYLRHSRQVEGSEGLTQAQAAREALRDNGLCTETYREIPVLEALDSLVAPVG